MRIESAGGIRTRSSSAATEAASTLPADGTALSGESPDKSYTRLRIHDVPNSMISEIWDLVSPMLSRAVKHHPHMELADILQIVMGNFAQLIVAIEGADVVTAAVMERVSYPKHTVGNILLLAGKPGTMGARLDAITEHLFRWAKTRGCDRIALIGLPGLTKVVKRHGGQSIRLIHAWRDI